MGVSILKYHKWVKYNPLLGNYWTEQMLGCFHPHVGLNVFFGAVTQLLGQNNPIAGLVLFLPSAGLYLTQHFLE